MDEINELIGRRTEITSILLVGTLVISRVLPIVFITPFLGGKLVPPETKMGISVGLGILMFGYASSNMQNDILDILNPLVYIVLLGKELFIGFTIGFIAVELFYAMEIAGRALDVMRGSNMAEAQVPELAFRASPLGVFNFQLLLIIFCALGGHRVFFDALIESYRVAPLDVFPTMSGGFASLVIAITRYTADLFPLALALVFPGLFATFMTDVVFGMLNRVAPQLNAYFMSLAVKPLVGLLFFFFSFAVFTEQLGVHAEHALLFLKRLVLMFD